LYVVDFHRHSGWSAAEKVDDRGRYGCVGVSE
jgi:hypothetical protein